MNELKTSTMSRDEWLEERRKGIGGSDVAALLGLNPYKTPSLFGKKRQQRMLRMAQVSQPTGEQCSKTS